MVPKPDLPIPLDFCAIVQASISWIPHFAIIGLAGLRLWLQHLADDLGLAFWACWASPSGSTLKGLESNSNSSKKQQLESNSKRRPWKDESELQQQKANAAVRHLYQEPKASRSVCSRNLLGRNSVD